MNKRSLLLGALGALVLAGSPAMAQTNVTFGHPLAATTHYGVGALKFKETLEAQSGGKYKVTIQRNDNEREMIESVQIGTLDISFTSTGPVGNFVPEVKIVDIPFLFRDYAHARATLDGPIGQDLLTKFPGKGLVALGWGENGFRHMTNSRRAVNTPDDLKGLKVRTMENQVHMRAFQTMGALPTPMAFSELVPALQQGTVDGQENPITVIAGNNLNQVQKYLTLTGHVYSPALMLMSPAMFNKLSAADKKLFMDAAAAGIVANRAMVVEVENSGVAELRKRGMEVVTDVDRSKFQAALGPAFEAYAKEFGAPAIQKIRDFK
jgi:tripartite ATP-independent transporter DctP family solute receptor